MVKGENDFLRARKGHELIGGAGEEFILGRRGIGTFHCGEGNDTFGAVNGSNAIMTGSAANTIIVAARQTHIENRTGNEDGANGGDHDTTVTNFTLGQGMLWVNGDKSADDLTFFET